jgi:hypothetical protein
MELLAARAILRRDPRSAITERSAAPHRAAARRAAAAHRRRRRRDARQDRRRRRRDTPQAPLGPGQHTPQARIGRSAAGLPGRVGRSAADPARRSRAAAPYRARRSRDATACPDAVCADWRPSVVRSTISRMPDQPEAHPPPSIAVANGTQVVTNAPISRIRTPAPDYEVGAPSEEPRPRPADTWGKLGVPEQAA